MRETSGMFTVAAPVVGSPVPLASNFTTLMTQLAFDGIAGLWIARGGPKKQFSTGWHAPAVPPQFASDVQLGCGASALTQWLAVVLVVVVLAHSVAPLQVPLGPQVQVPAVHAAMTLLVQAANAPPLNPDSAALPAQFLRLQGAGDGAAICPNEGTTLSQKRAATTVIVRVTVPMTSSVLPRGQAPRESCSSANRRYEGEPVE